MIKVASEGQRWPATGRERQKAEGPKGSERGLHGWKRPAEVQNRQRRPTRSEKRKRPKMMEQVPQRRAGEGGCGERRRPTLGATVRGVYRGQNPTWPCSLPARSYSSPCCTAVGAGDAADGEAQCRGSVCLPSASSLLVHLPGGRGAPYARLSMQPRAAATHGRQQSATRGNNTLPTQT